MAKKRMEKKESACPLCRHPLGLEECEKLKESLQQMISEKSSDKIKERESALKQQIETVKKEKDAEIAKMKEEREAAIQSERKFMQEFFEKDFAKKKVEMEQEHVKKEKELNESANKLQKQLTELQEHTKEEAEKLTKQKLGEIEQTYTKRLAEKDVQLERITKELESAKKTAQSTSGELIGTVGEDILFQNLQAAFPYDDFRRQRRGQNEADIIQLVSVDATHRVPEPIIYDNKEKAKVSKTDIEKAKGYRTVHDTSHVIIVCSELPNESGGKHIYEKDGVIIVHQSVVVEFVRAYRKFMIELFKAHASNINREKKESELFNLIKGPKFERFIRGVEEEITNLHRLQEIEEKDHNKLWAKRKLLLQKIEEARRMADAEISAIIQDTKEPIQIVAQGTGEFKVLKKKRLISENKSE